MRFLSGRGILYYIIHVIGRVRPVGNNRHRRRTERCSLRLPPLDPGPYCLHPPRRGLRRP